MARNVDIPISAVGGVMSLRLENGDDMQLKVKEGDYLLELSLNNFKKIKTEENQVGTAYVYGVYTSLRFYEPSLGSEFMKTDLKNGESVVVPLTQMTADDFPGYQDALRGLFQKFSAICVRKSVCKTHALPIYDRRYSVGPRSDEQ